MSFLCDGAQLRTEDEAVEHWPGQLSLIKRVTNLYLKTMSIWTMYVNIADGWMKTCDNRWIREI